MKQTYHYIKSTEKDMKASEKISRIKSGILTVFSLCLSSLFLFFTATEKAPPSDTEASEIVSVFKESYLYDFLDLEKCENEQNGEGSV